MDKMADTKTISYSALALIALTLTFMGGATLLGNNAYYCEASHKVIACDKLSSTGVTCYWKDAGVSKTTTCSAGWAKVTKDITPVIDLPTGTNAKSYICSTTGCVPK